MTTRRHLLLVCLVAAVAASCGRQPLPTTGTVEALVVEMVVRPDGGLDVEERLRLVPDGTTVRLLRRIASPYADAVTFRSAQMRQQPVELDVSGVSVAAPDRGSLTWTIDRTDLDGPLDVSISYSVTSAVAVRQPRGRLVWPVLEAGRGFDAGSVVIDLAVPDGVAIHDGTGVAEAGWHVEVAGGHVTARREAVAAAESATLLAVFDIDRSRVQQGQWEWDLDRQEQYALALVAAAGFILVVGLGILGQLRLQYPPASPDAPEDVRTRSRADGRMLSRGLRLAGIVSLAFALVASLAARWWLSGLGPTLQAVPGSVAVVALLFLVAASWYGRRA